jgi:hypothetical protein
MRGRNNVFVLIFHDAGITQYVYKQYRVDDSIENVFSNLRSLVAAKKKCRSKFYLEISLGIAGYSHT